jgi:hypothetical protein
MPFNFFSSKPRGPVAKDLVWINTAAKQEGFKSILQKHPDAIVAAWFNDTIQSFQEYLHKEKLNTTIRPARQIVSPQVENKTVILLEHYPLHDKEEQLWQSWKSSSLYILNSLDEPLFAAFGGERIVDIMRKMGMQENESVEHALISKSLRNAQEKIRKKVVTEHSANSSAEWFNRNFPSGA